MAVAHALGLAEKHGAQMVDFKFVDYPGIWQHFTVPLKELDAKAFEEGFGFDGSSIRHERFNLVDAGDKFHSVRMLIAAREECHAGS